MKDNFRSVSIAVLLFASSFSFESGAQLQDEQDRTLNATTPLSQITLQWDVGGPSIKPTTTTFLMNPKLSGKTFQWRGSKSTPVLVYDPKSTGAITSGDQIVGRTFRSMVWESGFDALASRDKDQDGKISGVELREFALWFDEGADGVVVPGELRTLTELDVIALYFDNYSQNTLKHRKLEKGFERKVAGITIPGSLTDWNIEAID